MVYKYIILVCMLLVFASCGAKQDEGATKEAAPEREVMQETITGEELLKNGQYKEAIAYYEASGETLELARAHLAYGNAYFAEEEHAQKALSLLEGLEEDFLVLYSIGYAHEIMQKYPEAIEYYKKAQDAHDVDDYNTALALNQIGHVYDLIGDMKMANQFYVEAEEYGQNIPMNFLNRGRYEFRTSNLDLALEYFEIVLTANISSFMNAELYNNIAIIYLQKSDLEKSIENSKKGIDVMPDYANNYLSLSIAYLYTEDEDDDTEILKLLEKAIELHPNYSLAYQYLGMYYYRENDLENSIKHFIKQKNVVYNDISLMQDQKAMIYADAVYLLAQLYAENEQYEESFRYIESALQTNEEFTKYGQFLFHISLDDGPFKKMLENEGYEQRVMELIQKYK